MDIKVKPVEEFPIFDLFSKIEKGRVRLILEVFPVTEFFDLEQEVFIEEKTEE